MVKDHSDSESYMGYSFRLTARVLLYAPSHRQSTYHGLCYTSRGALAGTRNSSMGPHHEGSIRRSIAPRADAPFLLMMTMLMLIIIIIITTTTTTIIDYDDDKDEHNNTTTITNNNNNDDTNTSASYEQLYCRKYFYDLEKQRKTVT